MLTIEDVMFAKAKFFLEENTQTLIDKLLNANNITDEIQVMITTIAANLIGNFQPEEIELLKNPSNIEEVAKGFGDCCCSCIDEAISHTLTGSTNSHFSRERYREYLYSLYRFIQQLKFLFETNLASIVTKTAPVPETNDKTKTEQVSNGIKDAVDQTIS